MGNGKDYQGQIDDLSAEIATNRAGIDRLQARADASDARADAAESRADAAEQRADAMEARSQLDREIVAELQADGVLSQEHAAQMEEALLSSRTIGAAVGILMASRQVTRERAFAILRQASQHGNRKLREVAADMVEHADQGGLVGGGKPLI